MEGEYRKTLSFGAEVALAFDRFWEKKQLSVDSKGRVYRTKIPRKRPNFDHVDFRNPYTKIRKGKQDG